MMQRTDTIIDGREILNFGKKFHALSFVRAKTLIARVQLAL